MKKLLWTFILGVAVVDAAFMWRCRQSASEWESNPVAAWVLGWGGPVAAISYRALWLGFAAGMAYSSSRLGRFVTPVWAAGHLYLLVILAQSAAYAPALAGEPTREQIVVAQLRRPAQLGVLAGNGHRTERSFGEAFRFSTEGVIETGAIVLPRDGRGQLHELPAVEVALQVRKEFIGDRHGRLSHRYGIAEGELLQVQQVRTMLKVREGL